MTRDQAILLWGILGSAGSGTPLDEATLQIRAELILDLDFDAALTATKHHAQTHKWVPSVAELRQSILAPHLPNPAEVWEEIYRLVQRHGWPSPPTETQCSPAAWRTIQIVGWQTICESEEVHVRAHVLKEVAPQVIERLRTDLLLTSTDTLALDSADPKRIEPGS